MNTIHKTRLHASSVVCGAILISLMFFLGGCQKEQTFDQTNQTALDLSKARITEEVTRLRALACG